jgi:cytochrome P450
MPGLDTSPAAVDVRALAAAQERAERIALDDIDVSHVDLYETDTMWPYFARLRREAPVHFCRESHHGPYWSLSRFSDIKQVDADHERFSSDTNITLFEQADDFTMPMFIAMDPPAHDVQRKAVAPVVAPPNLAVLESTIRSRVCGILDALPIGETFNWVDRVSIELTTQMLATLLDFPFDERTKLTHWSDVMSGGTISGVTRSREHRQQELLECLERFTALWHEKAARAPANDLISMLAHGKSTHDMIERPMEYLGNVMLLIVGGNDTTRNSISGGVLALNRFPHEYQKLRDNPSLVPNFVAEVIRWQTPLAHMRRTATHDVELHGQRIREGEKVVMWYISGNRDDAVFENPDRLIADRPNARSHVSFGYGIHRCMGNRLAEMQLRVLWEEILPRFHTVEVVGKPQRIRSNLIRGYRELPVRLHPH